MSETVDRVVVFMDYQNVHAWARRQFLPYVSDPSAGHVSRSRSANSSPSGDGARAS